ncbi:OmpA family protein [Burkholderia ambifaria]|uniref:OmpA family protein n=1 Tax=Burkholderia ambifaria TaxID=152480 RepID=UPI001B9C486B|nr:OmpA family protein [Burkholderia ambifaria]MBR8334151.1 OmpA family protein [Burkholderia ambifaria]
MVKTTIATVLATAVLAGCSSASGPTFDAYTVTLPNHQQAYRVRCDGLLEGQGTCDAKAREICGNTPVRLLEGQAPYSGGDMRLWTFQCGAPAQPAPPVQPAPAPAPIPAPAPPPKALTLAGDANFDFDKATLTAAAQSKLDQLVSQARGTTFRTVTVDGYTDARGSDAYNLNLSARRAQTVASYLRDHGLNAQQYVTHGYGKASPVATNATESGRSQNRRVEIRLDTAN